MQFLLNMHIDELNLIMFSAQQGQTRVKNLTKTRCDIIIQISYSRNKVC